VRGEPFEATGTEVETTSRKDVKGSQRTFSTTRSATTGCQVSRVKLREPIADGPRGASEPLRPLRPLSPLWVSPLSPDCRDGDRRLCRHEAIGNGGGLMPSTATGGRSARSVHSRGTANVP